MHRVGWRRRARRAARQPAARCFSAVPEVRAACSTRLQFSQVRFGLLGMPPHAVRGPQRNPVPPPAGRRWSCTTLLWRRWRVTCCARGSCWDTWPPLRPMGGAATTRRSWRQQQRRRRCVVSPPLVLTRPAAPLGRRDQHWVERMATCAPARPRPWRLPAVGGRPRRRAPAAKAAGCGPPGARVGGGRAPAQHGSAGGRPQAGHASQVARVAQGLQSRCCHTRGRLCT